MPRRVQDRQPNVARLVLITIHQRHIGKTRAGSLMEKDRSTGRRGQLTRTRNVIRLDVGLHDVADAHALFGGRLEIRLDVVLWVHHSARMCAASAQQVAGTPGLRREELAKDHGAPPYDRGTPWA